MRSIPGLLILSLLACSATRTYATDGNRLTYLDENNPYYVSRSFPKLVTPQWVGEEGVEAVVVLAIDDLRDPVKYEKFLRPILRRLKEIDGRAPLSIMTNQVDPEHKLLQAWLKEGLSLETHTLDHPCPLLGNGGFAKARATYDRCVDLLNVVPRNRPVAFRVPCCDSLNTPSPRFFAEIFNKTTAKNNFVTIDSSVFNLITSNHPGLPRPLVIDPDGQDRFLKYLPADRTFVNTIENYPYPYVLGRLCWELPCVTPSDWLAYHRHKADNPVTVADWKAAIDAIVLQQGVFNLVFHPHGWIRNGQIVDFIDHVAARHGKKVKFLTFREVQERLDKNLLAGQPLRAVDGQDNGVRLIDVNNDGYLDVVIANDKVQKTRIWSPRAKTWSESDFPTALVHVDNNGRRTERGGRFGIVHSDGYPSLLLRNDKSAGSWHFDGKKWIEDKSLLEGLELDALPIRTSHAGRDRGVRLRDLDRDGRCEVLVSNNEQQAIFTWLEHEKRWTKLPFALPAGASLVDAEGKDNGLRFIDVDEDGREDVIFSNEQRYSLHLFTSMQKGWSRAVRAGKRGGGGAEEIPPIAVRGTNNGAWFHSRHLFVQNENTALLKDHVDRRAFNDLLGGGDPAGKSAEASLHAIRTRPGFIVEQVAAEPLVHSPISLAWAADGKLWVVEMGDYPLGVDNKGKPGGRIKVLEDTNGDGKYTKATVFLDGLRFPTSVMPWRKGAIVICAPEIFYAEDTKGTGKADRRVLLYKGFTEGNPQHRANSLVWGLDNWIYCANGDSGGKVKSMKTGKVLDIRGMDFRIRPDNGDFDLEAGQTQYGRSRDDWGNWFGNNNSDPMWHYVLADHYMRRGSHFAGPDPRVHVPNLPGAARVYPVSRTLPRFNDPHTANHFTSANSAMVYRDDLFGPTFSNSMFVSEPVHNLVHREIIAPRGVTFTSRRAADEQTSEFLASSDNWFRPTMLQTGPDGALWLVDMYRAVIEHPEWIPVDWLKRLDLRAGQDKGRIYRVYPAGVKPRAIPRLDRLDVAGLVSALDSPSGWQRDTAQQMLLWKNDPGAVPLLEKLAGECQRPLGRLHALCTLDGMNALRSRVVKAALAFRHPGVRRQAVRLCEALLSKSPGLGEALVKMIDDDDPPVRLQLACTLGKWDDARAGQALAILALQNADDPFISAAVMSSVNEGNLAPVLLGVMKRKSPPAKLVENLLRLAAALQHAKPLATLLKAVAVPEDGNRYASWQFSALAGLLDSLDQRGTTLAAWAKEGDGEVKNAVQLLPKMFDAARKLLADSRNGRSDQLLVIRLLGRGLDRHKEDLTVLAELLVPQSADQIQAAAIAALGRMRDPQVAELLIRGWKNYGPAQRSLVLDALLGREEWMQTVLQAVETGKVAAAEIGATRRQRLLETKSAAVRKRAAKIFAGAVDPNRRNVVEAYQSVLSMQGDPRRGSEVFGKHCATCHKLGDVGHVVGPDLAALGDKSPAFLLTAILDPNRAVEARYVNYVATTKAGLSFTGVLAGETGTSITILGPDGKKQVILRRDLDELVSNGKSPMPEGLEKEIKPMDMADLIAHIAGVGPQPKRKIFEGNKPQMVRAGKDHALVLLAANAEIYGPTLILEKQYANLGYWTSENDRAVWTIDVDKAGKYAVWLNWACEKSMAGKKFLLEAGPNRLTGKVASTGGWDTYKLANVGAIILPAGQQRLTFRSAGRIFNALIDLKSVKLVPLKNE